MVMNNKRYDPDSTGNPDKVYNEELENKGSTFLDTPAEADARDLAKIQKASTGQSQKIDGSDPYEDGGTTDDDGTRRETLEKK